MIVTAFSVASGLLSLIFAGAAGRCTKENDNKGTGMAFLIAVAFLIVALILSGAA